MRWGDGEAVLGRLLEEVAGPQRAGAPEGRPGAKSSPQPGLGGALAEAPHSQPSRGCLLKISQLYGGWERPNQRTMARPSMTNELLTHNLYSLQPRIPNCSACSHQLETVRTWSLTAAF